MYQRFILEKMFQFSNSKDNTQNTLVSQYFFDYLIKNNIRKNRNSYTKSVFAY